MRSEIPPAYITIVALLTLLFLMPGLAIATVTNNTVLAAASLNQTVGTSYNWTINLSSTLGILDNVTAVTLNGLAATRFASATTENSSPGGNWTVWAYYGPPEALNSSWDDSCGSHFTKMTATDANGSVVFSSDAIYQMIPCLKLNTSVLTAVTSSSTEINITPPGYTAGNYQVLLPAVTYNSSHKYCPYTADNVKQVMANLAPQGATIYHCTVDLNRSASEVGVVPVYQAGYLSEIAPRGSGVTTNIVVFVLGVAAAALFPRLTTKKVT